MFWLGTTPLKKFPAPVLKPMAPFIASGLIVMYGINSIQNALMASDEWKNDPRSPAAKKGH